MEIQKKHPIYDHYYVCHKTGSVRSFKKHRIHYCTIKWKHQVRCIKIMMTGG